MAIYDPKVGEGVIPNLPAQSGFNVGAMTFGGIDSAITRKATKVEKDSVASEKNSALLKEATDKLTNFRVDNPNQQAIIDGVKASSGLTNVFNTASLESLKSPYGAKMVESAYTKFVRDPKVSQVVLEQAYSDKYKKDLTKINDPKLREMAIGDYQKYRTGEKSGDSLVADDYMEIDLPKVIGAEFKSIVPKVEDHMKRNGTYKAYYIESLKTRDTEAMKAVFENKLTDPKFVNNLVAKGLYDKETKALTSEGESFVNALTDQYTVEDAKMKNIKWDKTKTEISVNKTSTSTFNGTYNGNSNKNVSINKSGGFSYEQRAGKTKGDKAVNQRQREMAAYGVDVSSSDYTDYIESNKNDGGQDIRGEAMTQFLLSKALRDPKQSAFSMLAVGHDPAKVAKELIESIDATGKIAYPNYTNKGADKTLTTEFKLLGGKLQGEFLLRAYNEAKLYLEKNKGGSTTKTAPKYKASIKKNNTKDSGL